MEGSTSMIAYVLIEAQGMTTAAASEGVLLFRGGGSGGGDAVDLQVN